MTLLPKILHRITVSSQAAYTLSQNTQKDYDLGRRKTKMTDGHDLEGQVLIIEAVGLEAADGYETCLCDEGCAC